MNRVVVINVVGLCDRHIGPDMPFLSAFCERTQHRHIDPAFPAVTCTAQSDYATGKTASEHGIEGSTQINAADWKLVAWAAAIELASVTQCLLAAAAWTEQKEIRSAGSF